MNKLIFSFHKAFFSNSECKAIEKIVPGTCFRSFYNMMLVMFTTTTGLHPSTGCFSPLVRVQKLNFLYHQRKKSRLVDPPIFTERKNRQAEQKEKEDSTGVSIFDLRLEKIRASNTNLPSILL